MRGGRAAASRAVDRFRLATIAPSLGGVETLVEQPAVMSYHELGDEELAAVGHRAGPRAARRGRGGDGGRGRGRAPRGLGLMAHESFRRFEVVVGPADGGRRLDQFLAANVPDLSRRKARVLLDLGGVFVDGARTKVAGRLLRPGQVVVANVGGALERATPVVGKAARAEDEAALPRHAVVHLDDDVVVVDKPAGLLTAPTPESDRANLASVLRGELGGEVFVVHRIDLETSGLLVFARTPDANRALAERFRDHDVERVYLAVLLGALARGSAHGRSARRRPPRGHAPRRRRAPRRRDARALHARDGEDAPDPACTRATSGTRCSATGSTGSPRPIDPPRMALHAAVLGFPHPRTGAPLRFESPWPPDLAPWLDRLRVGQDA